MKIPNNKVGLVIGKGGETIKNFQARTGARIQVIPLHLPPGDTSLERTVQIEGTREQIDYAKQLVDEVTSENRSSNPANSGGYSQQGYQTRPASGWARGGASQMTQPNYGYVQQPQYSQPQYGGYPPQQASGGYPSGGYDYYGQQQQSSQTPTAAPGDNTGYNYNQAPASGYNQQGQAYSQDGYGAYYAAQSGYGQPTPYDQQQQSYSSAAPQDGQAPSYGTQGESAQAIQAQQGYGTNQQPASDPQGSTGTLSGYGIPPTSQSGYQAPAQSGYATAGGYGQKPPANPTAYGQTQQSPSNPSGYSQPGYAPSGYNNATTAQQGYGPASYGAGYGQQPQAYSAASYGSGYPQPAAYSADGTAHDAAAPTSQSGLAKESPQS
jgi:far upstream element-binding protein